MELLVIELLVIILDARLGVDSSSNYADSSNSSSKSADSCYKSADSSNSSIEIE